MESIQKILSMYDVHGEMIVKISERLYKVGHGDQHFALKRSNLTMESLRNWEHVFQQAEKHKLVSILPVYATKERSLVQEINGDLYYLSPWINGKSSTIKSLYHSIGMIHSQTKQSQFINESQMNKQFKAYKETCKEWGQQLLGYIKRFESHRYMSPIELQVCTHYHHLEKALKKCIQYVDRFLDRKTGKEQWETCLCHGNLKLSHIIEAKENYLINWERSHHGYAIIDLINLFKNEVVDYDAPMKNYIDLFNIYMQENKLEAHELLLLNIYLLDITPYMDNLRSYVEETPTLSAIGQVTRLEIIYRQLLFGLELSSHLETNYLSIFTTDIDD